MVNKLIRMVRKKRMVASSLLEHCAFLLAALVVCLGLQTYTLAAQPGENRIYGLAWNSDGTLLAIGGSINGQPALHVYDVEGQLVQQFSVSSQVLSISWSPDGSKIATRVSRQSYIIWDASTGSDLLSFEQLFSTGDDLVYWRPDGEMIAIIVGRDVELRDSSTGSVITTLVSPGGRPDDIRSAAWNADGTQFLTVSADNVVRFWDTATQTVIKEYPVDSNMNGLAFSPDYTMLALGNGGNFVDVIDVDTGITLTTLQTTDSGAGYQIGAVRWHPNGQEIAGSSTNRITIWNVMTGAIVNTIDQHAAGDALAVDYSASGLLAYANADGSPIIVLTVTDDDGATDTDEVAITVNMPPTTTP